MRTLNPWAAARTQDRRNRPAVVPVPAPRRAWAGRIAAVAVPLAVATAGLAGTAGPAAAQAAPAATPATTTFSYTGAEQTYSVPAGITAVTITAVGAPGGADFGTAGGHGASVTATVPLPRHATTLYVEVGGPGGAGGGFNGGGSSAGGGAGGGGASDVRLDPNTTPLSTADTRLVVAGGGGGAGFQPGGCWAYNDTGGTAGAAVTGPGGGGGGDSQGCWAGPGGNGGLGGTTGGAGGLGQDCGDAGPVNGDPGALGQGGDAPTPDGYNYGGGGGGGYYGGGAGGSGCGGGGGGAGSSSWGWGATGTSLSTDTTGTPQVQITPVPLTLKDTASPAIYTAAGQVITYSDKVRNIGPTTLTGIGVTDPAVPGVSCPKASLAPGTSETCTGTRTTTAKNMTAGRITDTATATATDTGGAPVTSNSSKVIVREGWPAPLTGIYSPWNSAHVGYYLGANGNTWQLLANCGSYPNTCSGKISVPAGTLGPSSLAIINPVLGDQVVNEGNDIIFTLHNPDGAGTGFRFTTSTKVPAINLDLQLNNAEATASQIYLGSTHTNPPTSSPLGYTR